MRTIVDIPDTQIKILDQLEFAFGIWQDKKLDSLEYQQKLRDEWVK